MDNGCSKATAENTDFTFDDAHVLYKLEIPSGDIDVPAIITALSEVTNSGSKVRPQCNHTAPLKIIRVGLHHYVSMKVCRPFNILR
jgi:hypothetical protein